MIVFRTGRLRSALICAASCCLNSLAVQSNNEVDRYLLDAVRLAPLVLPELRTNLESAEPGWFNEAEIRYSGSDLSDQSLAIRIRPKSSGERSAESGLIELRKMHFDLSHASAINSELEFRYRKLIEIFKTLVDVIYYRNKELTSEETIRVYRNLMHTEKFDVKGFQQANLAYGSFTRQHQLFENRLLQMISELPQSDIVWRRDSLDRWLQQLTPVTAMQQILNHQTEKKAFIESSTDFRNRHLQWRIAQQKLKRERSEKNSLVKYVELKHATGDSGESETTLSFSIPFGGGHSRLLDQEIAVSNADYSMRSSGEKFRLRIADLISAFNWQAAQYQATETAIDQLNRQYSKLLNSDQPILLLNLKDQLQTEDRQLKLRQIQALQHYIEFLSLTGRLSFWPLKNWLVQGAPEIGG